MMALAILAVFGMNRQNYIVVPYFSVSVSVVIICQVYVTNPFFRQMLFEQEDSNLYTEPVTFAKMVVEHFKVEISFVCGVLYTKR